MGLLTCRSYADPCKGELPVKFLAFASVVADALEAAEVSLTVMVTMSPIFAALTSAKSEPLAGPKENRSAQAMRAAARLPARGVILGSNICFGGVNEAAGSLFGFHPGAARKDQDQQGG